MKILRNLVILVIFALAAACIPMLVVMHRTTDFSMFIACAFLLGVTIATVNMAAMILRLDRRVCTCLVIYGWLCAMPAVYMLLNSDLQS